MSTIKGHAQYLHGGVPTITIACRYVHTVKEMVNEEDVQAYVILPEEEHARDCKSPQVRKLKVIC